MRVFTIVCLTFVFLGAVFCGEAKNFEDLDFESILKDPDTMKTIFECLMDRGPCGEFQKLRDVVPAMIETKCSQCTPKQKEKFESANKMLLEKYPKELEMVLKKYSPKSD